LIADVVTGKLDVRKAAAKLPELPAEPETLSAGSDPSDAFDLDELETDDE